MLLGFNSQCPAYDTVKVVLGDSYENHCKRCVGLRGVFSNGIDCVFSKTPVGEPKFKVGQLVYRNGFIKGEALHVVGVKWDGKFEWCYLVRNTHSTRRETYPTQEHILFATREECDKKVIEEEATALLRRIEDYEKRYGKQISGLNIKLLSPKSSTELHPQDSSPTSDYEAQQ